MSGETTSSGSTAAGMQPRAHEHSFGASVFDLAGNALGDDMPRMSPQVQATLAGLIDSGLERALATVQGANANTDANTDAKSGKAARWAIFTLCTTLIVMAFGVVGVVVWSLDSRLDKTEAATTATQKQLSELDSELDKHRDALNANVKMLAAHAVSLTGNANKTGLANYELLEVLVDKLGARDDIPKTHARPVAIEIPVTLRVLAGEK